MVFVHQTLHKANERLGARGSRTVAITPRSYLDFINQYVSYIYELDRMQIVVTTMNFFMHNFNVCIL